MVRLYFSFIFCLLFAASGFAQTKQIIELRYQAVDPLKSERRVLFDNHLMESFRPYVSPHQELRLTPVVTPLSSTRARKEVSEGGIINIFFAPPRTDLPYKINLINIPIMKGILGFRQIVVHKEVAPQLDKVRTLDDLKAFTIGQVKDWSDVNIFKSNGFATDTGVDLDKLFAMLYNRRFDLLPMGVLEIEEEFLLHQDQHKDLTIDERLMVYYPLPVMIHLDPNDQVLYHFIQSAIDAMIEDGTLDRLLEGYFSTAMQSIKSLDGPIFYLNNPNLPSNLPLESSKLWMYHAPNPNKKD